MKPKFLNERGAGLVLVLIVCAFVGAAAVYLMDLGKETEKKIANDSRVLSYDALVKNVTNKIQSGNTCTSLLAGTDITGAFNEDGVPIQLDLKLAINPAVLRAPLDPNGRDRWFVHNGTSIKDVRLYISERVRSPVRLDNTTDPPYTAAKGYIMILPDHAGVGLKLSRNKKYKIPIFLYYRTQGGAKILDSCSDAAAEAFFCTSIGGAYDSKNTTLPEDQRCQPDRSCFAYKSGITSSPGSCPAPYVASPIGWMGTQLFICQWCNRNALQFPELGFGYYFSPKPTTKEEMDNPVILSPIVSP